VGALGPAMMFICLLLLDALLGAALVCFAARCFGTIVELTAAGTDDVRWPDEPLVDWLGRAVYLLWLVAFWLAPVGIVFRILARVYPEGIPPAWFLLPVGLFWLLFPVSVLSSLSAQSRWVIFRPALLVGLARVFPATVTFYAVTALLVGVCAAVCYVTLASGWLLLMPVAAAVVGTTLFVYARLLGRLAWLLGRLEVRQRPPQAERKRPPAKRPPGKRPRKRGAEVTDPWAAPRRPRKDAEPPPKLPVEGYGIAQEDVPPPPAEATRPKKRRVKGYDLANEEPLPRPAQPPLDGYLPVGAGEEERREQGPAHPFLDGVYNFPFYPTSAPYWLGLCGGLLVVGLILQAMLSFWSELQH
jgi:hypothetical protein